MSNNLNSERADIPTGWISTEYGELLLSASNGIGGKQNKEGLGIPVSRIETIAMGTVNFKRIGYIDDYEKAKIDKHRLNDGDILFSHINSPTHLGKTAIFNGSKELYHGINLLRLVVDRELTLPRFFNYHCMYSRTLGIFSINAQHAVNQSSLNQKKLFKFELGLPPLAEQKVIADKLDELLAQVDTLKARLDAIPAILKRFRQSVLTAAVSGKLINDDTPSHSEWKSTSIGEITTDIRYGTSKKCSDSSGSTPVLRIPNISNGYVDHNNLKFADFDEKELSNLALKKGDLLIIRSNGSLDLVGKLAVVTDSDTNFLFAGYLIRIRVNSRIGNPKFIAICFNSPQLRSVISEKAKSTSGVNNINSKELASLPIQLPELDHQTEIVRRVEQLLTYADQVEQQVKNAQARVNQLTQSILAKAFRGELTEQWRQDNPELISGDNSAAALLERIKAERAATKPAKKKAPARKAKA
ncbi:MAG: type I restriction enzyme S subunit [Zhongshania marina]|jgi:type I restriction enzyme S subunit